MCGRHGAMQLYVNGLGCAGTNAYGHAQQDYPTELDSRQPGLKQHAALRAAREKRRKHNLPQRRGGRRESQNVCERFDTEGTENGAEGGHGDAWALWSLRLARDSNRREVPAGGRRPAPRFTQDDNSSRSQSGGPKAAATYEDECDESARRRRYEPGRPCFSYRLLEFIEAVEGGHFVGFG
jgi:hypothetical protein